MTENKEQNTTVPDLSNTAQDMTHIKTKRSYYYTDRAKLLFIKGTSKGKTGKLDERPP